MAKPPYRALRILLRTGSFPSPEPAAVPARFLAVLLAFGSFVMIFSNKPLIVRMFMRPPEAEVSTLLLFVLKEMGGIMLMLAALLWFASRDPVRNVAIVDAFIIGLLVLSVTPLISLATLAIRDIYPAYFIWGRSLVRLAVAALFCFLRPRGTYSA